MSKPKITINQDKCIGCNTCPLVDPKVFALDQSTYKAIVKQQPPDGQIPPQTQTAIDSCPVQAIVVVEEP